jgi:DNA polymerase-3 subunit gamma/tau
MISDHWNLNSLVLFMSEYQVIARKFRPQTFKEVVGQDAIVTTLKNAIKLKRLAQAYLFCGSRGTGKTTLARIFAKALNCLEPLAEGEPCGSCPSCREIANGSSLDVIEIDGASNRGIEDIRQINETVGYAASSGGYKIYIIDEVHMLTKEAFNALLKTLEEPPPKVKFFFATTEPHKVLPTILSRCQRYNLNRIPLPLMTAKLRWIVEQLKVEAEEEALIRLAQRAEGGLRDAESLLDQVLAFSDGCITLEAVHSILGLMPLETFFELDHAGKEGQLAKAFEIAHRVFSEGKDLSQFIEGLIEHIRTILLFKLTKQDSTYLALNQAERERYAISARLYSQDQCLDLIDYLVESIQQMRSSTYGKIALEAILLHVMRSHYRLTVGQLVARLSELEQCLGEKTEIPQVSVRQVSSPPVDVQSRSLPLMSENPPLVEAKSESKPLKETQAPLCRTVPDPIVEQPQLFSKPSVSEDPTPSLTDVAVKPALKSNQSKAPVIEHPQPPKEESLPRPIHEYDTLLHFAAIELEGKLQKHHN